MDEREKFVLEALSGRYSMTELCDRFGISRRVGYKWLDRFHRGGSPALRDQSRAPRKQWRSTTPEIVARIIRLRKKHPNWGARKLRQRLMVLRPDVAWPAASTIVSILGREGLLKPGRRRKRARSVWRSPRTAADLPNRVWTADFKGQFRLGNGQLCYPLTIMDAFSRYVLCCHGLEGTAAVGVQSSFQRVFRRYGMPEVIRTDNGVPFSTNTVGGLSSLAVWWTRMGIRLERIRPGKPQENGAHERMHRALKEEATRPAGRTLALQQRLLRRFRRIYNDERPHEALDFQTPASLYRKSERPIPESVPAPVYPAHFQTRRINHRGQFSWNRQYYFISETLRRQTVGLELTPEGLWDVYFGPILIAQLDDLERRLQPFGSRLSERHACKKVYTMCPV